MGTPAKAKFYAAGGLRCVKPGENRKRVKDKFIKADLNYPIISFALFAFSFFIPTGNAFAQTPEQIEYYSERLQFGTEDVKRNALSDLRNFETGTASRIALSALRDSSEIIRATATRSVIYLSKEESARALLPLLSDKSEFVRREAIYALGETRNPQAASELIIILQKDKKQSVRDAAAVSLGKLGNPVALPHLAAILNKKPKKEEDFLRRAAARSIGQIAETIQRKDLTLATPEDFLPMKYKKFEIPKYKDLFEVEPAFRVIFPVLYKVLQNPKEPQDARREAAFALGAIGSDAAKPILQAYLTSEDYYLAEICEEAILKINSKNK